MLNGNYTPKLFEKSQVLINRNNESLNLSEDPTYPGFYKSKFLGSGSSIVIVAMGIKNDEVISF